MTPTKGPYLQALARAQRERDAEDRREALVLAGKCSGCGEPATSYYCACEPEDEAETLFIAEIGG